MTITPENRDLTAGLAGQRNETISPSPDSFLTGDEPALVTTDELLAPSQTLVARTVVGFDGGKIVPARYAVNAAAKASKDIVFSGTGTDGDTVTIAGVVYILKDAPAAAYDVQIGASAAVTAVNLNAAINASGTEGTEYFTGTLANPAAVSTVDTATVTVTARAAGANGNLIAVAEDSTQAAWAGGATALSGGADAAWIGVRPIGILVYAHTTGGSDTTVRAAVYRAGVFNPALLVWDASFDSDEKKRLAFEGAPAPTNIIIRKPQAFTTS